MLALAVNSRQHPRRRPLSPSSWEFSDRSNCPLDVSAPCFLPSAFCFLPCPLCPLCFQSLPTIKFCNPFVLITIRIAGRVRTPSPSATPVSPLSALLCFHTFTRCPICKPFVLITLQQYPGVCTPAGLFRVLAHPNRGPQAPASPDSYIPFQSFRRANDALPLQ